MLGPMSAMRVVYLGHATALLEGGRTRLLTDPLLRPSLMGLLRRRHGIPSIELDGIDGVLISHVHHDHLDLPSLRGLPRSVPILVPRGAGRLLAREGFTAVEEIAPGQDRELGDLKVRATPAVHEATRRGTDSPDSIGYRVEDERASVYFAGDTELFDGMREIGDDLDLALLPIWGWGPTLGAGHMNPEQAATALDLLRPRRAVPIHWGTYTPVGAARIWPWMSYSPAQDFARSARERAPGTEVVILAPGEGAAAAG